MATLTLRPSADVYIQQDIKTGSDAYAMVNEAVLDKNTDCASDAGYYQLNLYSYPSSSLSGVTISSVAVYTVVNQEFSLAYAAKLKLAVKVGGTTYYSGEKELDPGGSTETKSNSWITNPNTGLAWTTSEIDSLVAGCSMNSKSTSIKCWNYQLWVVVTYTASAPTVTTSDPTDITQTSFTANGNLTATGGATVTKLGFVYKTGSGDPTIADSFSYGTGSFSVGAYELCLSSLSTGTTYRVRAYAENSVGIGYGSTIEVTTLSYLAPTVSTGSASSIGSSSFTMGGEVTLTGGQDVTRRGFCYSSTNTDPTISDSVEYEDGTYTAEAYSLSIVSLNAGKKYYIKAYAVNSIGTSYGSVVEVTTHPLTLTANETFTLSDEFSRQVNFTRNFSETFTLTDSSSIDLSLDLYKIVISPFNKKMVANSSQQLGAFGYYNYGELLDITNSVTWSSSNPAVATVDSNGFLTSYTSGLAFIKASLGTISAIVMLQDEEVETNITEDSVLYQIPISSDPNQTFNVTIPVDGKNITLGFYLRWNDQAGYWMMTIYNYLTNTYYIDSLPLISGILPSANLLKMFSYLRIGSCYLLNVSGTKDDYPTVSNLGTDFLLFWGDTEI